jgi:hypothetical protein
VLPPIPGVDPTDPVLTPPEAIDWRLATAALGGLVALCQGIDTIHHYGDHYVAW